MAGQDAGESASVGAKRGQVVAAGGVIVVALLAWLWPIGAGGRMPIGGDVTQFSIGLMAELARAIRAGRIPFWNDLWGSGFPGLAESQMGVYYPPHLILYGLLPLELAYTLSLVGHTLWAGLGTAWAARRFGATPRASAVSGIAWASSGFFLIHLPHQWGATTASWMPWAWGLAWQASRGDWGWRAPLLLAASLTLQLLPGHFQLAFITQASVVLIGVGGLTARTAGGVARPRRLLGLIGALGAVVPLGLAQLGPTVELAGLAKSQRDVDYLSAFAATPLHLVSYVAPGLFHESPLWRPLAWDAFHAMPEEHRAAIGLVPLFLACLALRAGAWRDPSRRTLVLVALVTTLFSLGPYVPGFAMLCRVPGFSFFRAPARWGSAAMLALALLAGRGLDAWPGLAHPGRGLRRFVLVAAAWVGVILGGFELALAASGPVSGRPAWPGVSQQLDRAFALLPWDGEPSLMTRLAAARRPLDDARVPIALARQGRPGTDPADRTLARRRGSIYLQELGPTLIVLVVLFVGSFVAGKSRRGFEALLLALMVGEAGYWSRQRPFDLGPIRPLAEQSAALRRLAEMPGGTRSIDPTKNLPMAVGLAPVEAYRTLDLPVLVGLARLAALPTSPPEAFAAQRAIGVGVRVVSPGEPATLPGWATVAEVDDPTLLGWISGADFVRSVADRFPARFSVLRPPGEPARAWFVSRGVGELARVGDDPRAVLAALAPARPVAWRATRPEEVAIEFEADGPGSVVLARLDYPRWRARLAARDVPIVRVFEGWQGVEVPSAGKWSLTLTYDAGRDRACLAISGVAWLAWILLYWRARPPASRIVEEEVGR